MVVKPCAMYPWGKPEHLSRQTLACTNTVSTATSAEPFRPLPVCSTFDRQCLSRPR